MLLQNVNIDADTECYQHSMPANHNSPMEAVMTSAHNTTSPSKICTACKADKPLPEYNANNAKPDGKQHRCRDCQKAYFSENYARIAKQKREYNATNSERICAQRKRFRAENVEKIRQQKIDYRLANLELLAQKDAAKRDRRKIAKPLYTTWVSMKSRCGNANAENYIRYGGRGISVCERWANSYEAFESDMGPKPTPEHQIDRIDNDANYEPSNCRWVTPKENIANRGLVKKASGNTGLVGVHFSKEGVYCAQLVKQGKVYQRKFDNFLDAACYRKSLEDKFNRGLL